MRAAIACPKDIISKTDSPLPSQCARGEPQPLKLSYFLQSVLLSVAQPFDVSQV